MKRLSLTFLVFTACVSLKISPAVAAVNPGQAVSFIASVAQGAPPVVWTSTGGTISTTGAFTAPPCSATLPQTITVTAASGGQTATQTFVVDDKVTAVSISPSSATVAPGGTIQFTATVKTVCFPAGVTASIAPANLKTRVAVNAK